MIFRLFNTDLQGKGKPYHMTLVYQKRGILNGSVLV